MKMISLEQELRGNSYPGRGIVIGRSADGTKAVAAISSWEEVKQQKPCLCRRRTGNPYPGL